LLGGRQSEWEEVEEDAKKLLDLSGGEAIEAWDAGRNDIATYLSQSPDIVDILEIMKFEQQGEACLDAARW